MVYIIKQGARTLWKRWDSDERVGSGMNSFNHHQFAYVSEWFYPVVAGIAPAGADPMGVTGSISVRRCWRTSSGQRAPGDPRGTLSFRWERRDGRYEGSVTLPWNSTGRLRLPWETSTSDLIVNGSWIDPDTDADGGSLPPGVGGVEHDHSYLVVYLRAGEHEYVHAP